MVKSFFRRKSLSVPSPGEKVFIYLGLGIWTVVVLFPIYWLVVTSFKLPIDVNTGPFYIPFVDYKPSLHAGDYILAGDLAKSRDRAEADKAGPGVKADKKSSRDLKPEKKK